MAGKKTEEAGPLKIERLPSATVRVPIVGTSPMIMHRFSEKAKRQMLEIMQGKKKIKEIRDPEADYEASMHRTKSGGYGSPAVGFKQATVSAARFYGNNITMTALRQVMFFSGEAAADGGQSLVPIEGEPVMREDFVRLSKSSTDLRYRAQFTEWSAKLIVTYVTTSIDDASLVSLIDAGGLGVGVGDWRPEKGGEFGTYMVDPTQEMEVLK